MGRDAGRDAGGEHSDDDQQLHALPDLGGKPTPAPHTAPRIRSRGQPAIRPRHVVAGFAFLVVALAAIVLLDLAGGPGTILAPSKPYVLTFASKPFACPALAAWSPDGKRFAVLGYTSCGAPISSTVPIDSGGVLATYDAATRSLLSVTDLDALIKTSALPSSVTSNKQEIDHLALAYGSLAWSADNQRIACTYVGGILSSRAAQPTSDPNINGLVLIPIGQASGVPSAIDERAPAFTYPSSPLTSHPSVIWNLATRTQELLQVQPALAYQWSANDTLRATDPLTSMTVPVSPARAGAVGDPIGDTSFTLWQEGAIQVNNARCAQTATGEASYFSLSLNTGGAAWSPDGRVFLPGGLEVSGRFAVPVPSSALLASGLCTWVPPTQFPILPVRDAGLRAALGRVTSAGRSLIAWSADGNRLALSAVLSQNATNGHLVRTYSNLSILNCTTGKVLSTIDSRTLEPNVVSDTSIQYAAIEWAPDGRHLLLLDHDNHALILLGPGTLGN